VERGASLKAISKKPVTKSITLNGKSGGNVSLKHLTREHQSSLKGRFKIWLRVNALTLIGASIALAYLGHKCHETDIDLTRSNSALYRIAHETALKGCPVFSNAYPTHIVISADSPKRAREAIDRIANDIDAFSVALGKIPTVQPNRPRIARVDGLQNGISQP
jgi:hypothetical protein